MRSASLRVSQSPKRFDRALDSQGVGQGGAHPVISMTGFVRMERVAGAVERFAKKYAVLVFCPVLSYRTPDAQQPELVTGTEATAR